jgi:hypothetical protein
MKLSVYLTQLFKGLQLRLLCFFGEALPNAFSENNSTSEAPEGRSHFLYYGDQAKK